jgi:iron complex transport system substrate-binding protein
MLVPELRLLPLLSSATEIVHALGLGKFQVGRSHECDYPPDVLSLPVCTRPSFPVSGSSQEIDRLVKERLAAALSVYEVNAELVRKLRPTHIITQTQCKVCAVSLDDVEAAIRDQLETDAQIIPLEAYALAGLWQDIRQVAERCNAFEAGEELIQDLNGRMSEIAKQAGRTSRSPTVAAIEWIEPLMAAGNWVPELIEMANGHNLFGSAGEHSPWMTWEELKAADPDVIVALPCGFDLARTHQEARRLKDLSTWSDLRATRTGNVFVCDGNQFINRPGPRLLESLRIFAEILHPELFEPILEGIGWERL